MSDIKIAFFDIDGTLIDMGKQYPSENTQRALMKLKERHILICLATGRSPMALPHLEDVCVDAALTYNGSYCFEQQRMIFSNPIPRNDVKTIIKNASSISRPVMIAAKDKMVANGKDADLVEYAAFGGLEVVVSKDFEKLGESENIYQVMLGCRAEDHRCLMEGVQNAKITAWWDRAVDIIPLSGGKGLGVREVLEYYHMDSSEAIAFGDGNNDIDMLRAVGVSIAMGNASEELKQMADGVCGSAAEDGIYHYCVENGLI